MSGTPDIDLASEMGLAFTDYMFMALVFGVALVFLFRRRIWPRKGAAGACDSCPGGCDTGGECTLPAFNPSLEAGVKGKSAPSPHTDPSKLA